LKVQYEIKRKPRQKHTYLRFSKGKFIVSTNLTTSSSQIEAFVVSHSSWIEKQIIRYETREKITLEFEDKSPLQFFGETVILQIFREKGSSSLDIEKKILSLYVKENTKNIRKAVLNFSRKILLKYYEERVLFWANFMNLEYKSIMLNNAIKQWAHCTRDGRLVFSLKTIVLSRDLLDYLIVHELSHLGYFNHGKAFYCLVSHYIPDYKEKQEKLKTFHSVAVAFVKEKEE